MSEASSTAVQPSPSRSPEAAGGRLASDHGVTRIADSVVAKIAGIAAREISGVHAMGSNSSRALGSLRERIPVGANGPSITQGVAVEVGERQAAVDLDIVVEYGVSIADLAEAVRQNVIRRVEGMAGLEVTEVNITIDDIDIGDGDGDEEGEQEAPRVS